MTQPPSPHRTGTRTVRAGVATDEAYGAVMPPLHLSSTFAFAGFGQPRAYDYTRSGNPTRSLLAGALADLEGGAAAVITSTGMSAVLLALHLLRSGDVILAAHDCYGGTRRLLNALEARGQLGLVYADLTAPDATDIVTARRPRLVWIETPSNPLLRITAIRRVASAAHAIGALVVVDNTFLSPVLQQPLALGADLVVHSTTKYLNGHSDVVGGAIIAADHEVGEQLAWWANCLGITGAPFDSYLTLRGLRTLHARMRVHLENAGAVVEALCRHPVVEQVHYPGLATHPGHAIARMQQTGFGAIVSFALAGGPTAVNTLVSRLRCFTLAESLGGVESLIAHPATMTHASISAEERAAAGISDALLRLSVGIEHAGDLVADLTTALDAVAAMVPAKVVRPRQIAVKSREGRQVDVVLLGVGSVGRELLAHLAARGEASPALRVAAVIDRSGVVCDPDGARLLELRAHKAGGRALVEFPGGSQATPLEALGAVTASPGRRFVLVDATAADTTALLGAALERGAALVLANKLPLAGPQSSVDHLWATARAARRALLFEATVGAGLPVIDTIYKLLETGDDLLSIEGCPSGTLGFLFGELGRGRPFGEALREAVARGYTEPDPRDDLSGRDVARKALILARAIGFRGELADVAVQSLVPARFAAMAPDEFLVRVDELDEVWHERVRQAQRRGQLLRYRVQVTPRSIAVGLTSVALTDPLASLHGTDNQFTFVTARYHPQPLVITGPGSGPAVTAAGIVNDLLRLARAALHG